MWRMGRGFRRPSPKNSPNGRMNDLAHNKRPILQELVPDLCLGHKTACAGPLSVFRLKLSKKLIWGNILGYRMEILRLGVDRSRSSTQDIRMI